MEAVRTVPLKETNSDWVFDQSVGGNAMNDLFVPYLYSWEGLCIGVPGY